MAFDVAGARKAGYSEQEIADHLAQTQNFDVAGARRSGYSDADIIGHLISAPQTKSKVDADAERFVASTPKAVRAFTQGVTLGAGDELDAGVAAAQTALGNTFKRLTGKPVDYSSGDAYRAVQRAESHADKQYAAQKPLTAGVLNFAGALSTPGMGALGKFVAKGAPALAQTAKEVPVVGNALSAYLGAGKGAAVLRAATTGAATGAGAGAALADPGQRGAGAAMGAATGAVIGAGAQKVANALDNPFVETAQRRLSRQGVDLTPGQMVGGLGKRVEDVMTSAPITGGAINKARARGIEDLNRAVTNRVLDPIGESLSATTAPGHDAVQEATQKISNFYDAALAPVQVSPDEQFVQQVHEVLSKPNLPASVRSDLNDIVTNTVAERFKPGTSGRDWKNIDAELGSMIRAADNASGNDPVKRYLKDGLGGVQDALRGVLQRQDATAAAKVAQADEATANLVRLRQGAQSLGADEGKMTGAQLMSATRATDTSAGNRQFATGNALMQDLAKDAVKVLPNKVPDSGTALRGMVGLGAYGGAAGALGTHGAATALAADVLGSTLYSKPVIRLVNNIYRATDRKAQQGALTELEGLAARDPQVAKLYQRITAQLAARTPNALIEQTERATAPSYP